MAKTCQKLVLHGIRVQAPRQHFKQIQAMVKVRITGLGQAQGKKPRKAQLQQVVLTTLTEMGLRPAQMKVVIPYFEAEHFHAQPPKEPHANNRSVHALGGADLAEVLVAPDEVLPSTLRYGPPEGPQERQSADEGLGSANPLTYKGQGEMGDDQEMDVKGPWLKHQAEMLADDWVEALGDEGQLKVQQRLGKGSFGTVYAVSIQDEKWALKVQCLDPLRPLHNLCVYQELVALRELGGAHCPGILNYGGFWMTRFNIQLLTQLFDLDLYKFNKHHHFGIAESDAKTVCGCIAKGLHHMHGRGYVHRDLKPENIFVTVEPLAAVIGDLGCAFKGEGTKEHCTTVTHQAPELFLGSGYNFHCDIWSFGLICMEVEDKRALCQLMFGLGDWEEPSTQGQFLQRLLQKLIGDTKLPGAWSAESLSCLPLECGPKAAFGKRFANPWFRHLMHGLLLLDASKRPTITEVEKCTWLEVKHLI